jgi:hypothetical protein
MPDARCLARATALALLAVIVGTAFVSPAGASSRICIDNDVI